MKVSLLVAVVAVVFCYSLQHKSGVKVVISYMPNSNKMIMMKFPQLFHPATTVIRTTITKHVNNCCMVHGFQQGWIPQGHQRRNYQHQQAVRTGLSRISLDGVSSSDNNNRNCGSSRRATAVVRTTGKKVQQLHQQQPYKKYWTSSITTTAAARTTTTSLFYCNNYRQQQDRSMSRITEANTQERLRKKQRDKERGIDTTKKKKKEPYEWLPFWTTPERDPYGSIYIQDPIAEKDCTPLRLHIPAEVDMLEIGTMCAMLFLTTPDLDTYESMPNGGDTIFLKGDLGSGKSVFARGFVRGALGNWDIDVPSPTYVLSNTYFASDQKGSNKNLEIHHMDLYRLQDHANQQFFMLNLDHVFKNCLSLIEWPERLPEHLVPENRLELSIEYASLANRDGTMDMNSTKQFRILTFTPYGYLWRRRVFDIRYMGYVEDLKMKEKDEFNPNNPQD